MPRLAFALLLCLATVASTARADVWRYRFEPGHAYRFHYQERTNLEMSLPMMGEQTQKIAMDTDFSLHVTKRLADGRSDAVIDVDQVRLTQANGQTLTLAGIPPEMRTIRATITPRGQFEFYERTVVQVEDDGTYAMGVIDARHGSASASATAGGETVTASARIDPKTGRVSASITREKAARHTHTEERRHEAQPLEILPSQVLALMELPEGPVEPGASFDVDNPMMKISEQVLAPAACGRATCGRLQLTAKTNASAETASATSTAMAPGMPDSNMGGMPDMQMPAMGGMAGMGAMPGMGGGSPMGAGSPAMPSMTSDVSAEMAFDAAGGRLVSVTGTESSKTRGPGLSVDSDGRFTLQAR